MLTSVCFFFYVILYCSVCKFSKHILSLYIYIYITHTHTYTHSLTHSLTYVLSSFFYFLFLSLNFFSLISQVLQNKTDTAGGFKWRLARGGVSAGDVGVGAADDMDDDEVRPVLRGVTVCGM